MPIKEEKGLVSDLNIFSTLLILSQLTFSILKLSMVKICTIEMINIPIAEIRKILLCLSLNISALFLYIDILIVIKNNMIEIKGAEASNITPVLKKYLSFNL